MEIINYIKSHPKSTLIDLVDHFGAGTIKLVREAEKQGKIIKIIPTNGIEYYQRNKYYER